MIHDQNNPDSVTHRTKGNKPPRKLADELGFKRLAELVEGRKIDKARTLEHIDMEATRDERRTNRPV